MNFEAKELAKRIQVELCMGEIRAISNANISTDEKLRRIQRATDSYGRWVEELEKDEEIG